MSGSMPTPSIERPDGRDVDADRDLDGGAVRKSGRLLDRALAVRTGTHDDRPAAVLQGRRHDLGSAGRTPVDEHDEGRLGVAARGRIERASRRRRGGPATRPRRRRGTRSPPRRPRRRSPPGSSRRSRITPERCRPFSAARAWRTSRPTPEVNAPIRIRSTPPLSRSTVTESLLTAVRVRVRTCWLPSGERSVTSTVVPRPRAGPGPQPRRRCRSPVGCRRAGARRRRGLPHAPAGEPGWTLETVISPSRPWRSQRPTPV